MTKETILSFLREHKDILKDRYKVEKIGIFGSFIKNKISKNSDIDFYVVLKEKKLDYMTGLWLYLEENLNKKVDLIFYHKNLRKGLKKEIEKEIIYA